MKAGIFNELVDLTEAVYEAESRVLRNVILIKAGWSENRRRYTEAVLQTAAPVFEGARAFDSHAPGERKVADMTGWYTNVRYHEGKLIADRHFTRTDAGRNVLAVVEDILTGTAPKIAGLSINAVGSAKRVKYEGGEGLEVESITAAHSVDDVVSPAAGGGYSLTASYDSLTVEVLSAIDKDDLLEARPDIVEAFKKEWQVIRQDAAFKTLQSEAERLQTDLTEAQGQLSTALSANETLTRERDQKALELELERMLRAAKLPAVYEEDLRARLIDEPVAKWVQIIETERKKASVNTPRVPVSGAGQQVHSGAIAVAEATNPLLYYGHVNSPEEHAQFMERLKSKR